MPKAIEIDDILMAIYRYRHLDESKEERTPLKFADFRKIMIASGTIMGELTIRTRYDQLVFAGYATVMPGKVKQLLLDNISIVNDLIMFGRIAGKPRRRLPETDPYTFDIHTHIHTEEGSQ